MKVNRSRYFKAAIVLSIISAIAFSFYQATNAQRRADPKAMRKSEAELQSQAVTRVQPRYAPLALAARISGQVVVQVTIDEEGDVITARVLSGHPLLKDSALTAAQGWKFKPFVEGGAAVKVTGPLTFNFDPDTYVRSPDEKQPSEETPPPLTAEEKEKLPRVEDAANRFIERWHETLDMNVVFDELYVSNPQQRSLNVRLFYGVYKFISGSGYAPAVGKGVDESVMREGFMAFWNIFYLSEEYRLAFQKSEDQEDYVQPEMAEAFEEVKKVKLDEKRIILAQVRQFIEKANRASSLMRKYLTREAFDMPLYKANLKKCREETPIEIAFSIERGFPEYGVGKEKEVYNLEHCVFDFYFVEEAGQLKVLTLGFEL